jgi:hypothetical protein
LTQALKRTVDTRGFRWLHGSHGPIACQHGLKLWPVSVLVNQTHSDVTNANWLLLLRLCCAVLSWWSLGTLVDLCQHRVQSLNDDMSIKSKNYPVLTVI